jgi:hypothetical protein
MLRAGYNLIALAVKVMCAIVLILAALGILPGPLLWWLLGEALRAAWAFLNLPPFVQGVGVGLAVYVALAKWFHNAPLKAQRSQAIEKAHQSYEAQKW